MASLDELNAKIGDKHPVALQDAQVQTKNIRDSSVTPAKLSFDPATQVELDAHAAAADPHTGYRLESADHSHLTTGPQAGTLAEAALALTDILTNDASLTRHGFLQKLPGGTATFLRADGTFAAPTAAAADPVYAPGSFTVVTGSGRYIPKRLQLTGAQRATIQGATQATSGRLRVTN